MENQNQNQQNAPHGSQESVPSRQGMGKAPNPAMVTDDEFTSQRRAYYGQPDNWIWLKVGDGRDLDFDVNDTKTPNNLTRDVAIRRSNSDNNPQTGFGRAMVQ